MNRKKLVWMIPAAIVGIAVFIFLGGEIVRLLWNALLPPLFGWPAITFWQGLGLLVLCRILFGGWSGNASGRSGMRRRMARMTPEERERFRDGMRRRCGFGPAADDSEAEGQSNLT